MQEPKSNMQQDFRAYLNPLGYLETHYTRMMSSLSSVAYRMDRLTPTYLRRLHGLELRYTSLACERVLGAEPPAAEEALSDEEYGCDDGALCGVALARCAAEVEHVSAWQLCTPRNATLQANVACRAAQTENAAPLLL